MVFVADSEDPQDWAQVHRHTTRSTLPVIFAGLPGKKTLLLTVLGTRTVTVFGHIYDMHYGC